jgi:hypothetical protein
VVVTDDFLQFRLSQSSSVFVGRPIFHDGEECIGIVYFFDRRGCEGASLGARDGPKGGRILDPRKGVLSKREVVHASHDFGKGFCVGKPLECGAADRAKSCRLDDRDQLFLTVEQCHGSLALIGVFIRNSYLDKNCVGPLPGEAAQAVVIVVAADLEEQLRIVQFFDRDAPNAGIGISLSDGAQELGIFLAELTHGCGTDIDITVLPFRSKSIE